MSEVRSPHARVAGGRLAAAVQVPVVRLPRDRQPRQQRPQQDQLLPLCLRRVRLVRQEDDGLRGLLSLGRGGDALGPAVPVVRVPVPQPALLRGRRQGDEMKSLLF